MPNAVDFEHLSVAEKIELVTQLWDQIARSGKPVTLPDSVIAEGERRLDDMMVDPSLGITEDEMWQRANALRKKIRGPSDQYTVVGEYRTVLGET